MKLQYNVSVLSKLLNCFPKSTQRRDEIKRIWKSRDQGSYLRAKARRGSREKIVIPVLSLPATANATDLQQQHAVIEEKKKAFMATVIPSPLPDPTDPVSTLVPSAPLTEYQERVVRKCDKATERQHRTANQGYGVRTEDSAIRLFETKYGFKVIGQQRVCVGTYGDITLVGKVDGMLEDGTVIEVKNRQNKLFNSIPLWEKIQLQTYLHLCNASSGFLCQRKDGEINFMVETRDIDWWLTTVLDPLKTVHAEIVALLDTPALQDAFLSK